MRVTMINIAVSYVEIRNGDSLAVSVLMLIALRWVFSKYKPNGDIYMSSYFNNRSWSKYTIFMVSFLIYIRTPTLGLLGDRIQISLRIQLQNIFFGSYLFSILFKLLL